MTTTAPSSDVFISYNRRDTSAAEQIARALTERGLSVFLDRWTLQPGTAWTPALEAALVECGTVLVLVGRKSFRRSFAPTRWTSFGDCCRQ